MNDQPLKEASDRSDLSNGKKLRVAFMVWRFPILSEAFIVNQIAGLMERGHEVHIHALNGLPKDATSVHPLVEQYDMLKWVHYPPTRPQINWLAALKAVFLLVFHMHLGSLRCLRYVGWRECLPWSSQAGHTPWKKFYRSIGLLGAQPYDVVHCQFGTLGPPVLEFRQDGFISGKLVTIFRGIDISEHVATHGEDVYAKLFQSGDYFLANCRYFRDRAVQLGCNPRRIEVIGSGIDCERFRFSPRYMPADGHVRIATCGRLVAKKGTEYLIESIGQLVRGGQQIELVIIGDGPLKAALEKQVAELGIEKNVNFQGWRNHQEISEILDTCQMFAAPSVTAEDGNQDAPVNTLKEAMAMGLPVVSTWHGGIPELVEDGVSGFLVPERNSEALAKAIQMLISEPEWWPMMGAAGRAKVESVYAMDVVNDQIVSIYRRLINEDSETLCPSGSAFSKGENSDSSILTKETHSC
jgi:colanic acid/amylovoran biosynthesis glycosyltransferase